MNFIFNLAISIYITSTLFMLYFWVVALITTFRQTGKIFIMPVLPFLYNHFCPIVNTVKCFKIMKRAAELRRM